MQHLGMSLFDGIFFMGRSRTNRLQRQCDFDEFPSVFHHFLLCRRVFLCLGALAAVADGGGMVADGVGGVKGGAVIFRLLRRGGGGAGQHGAGGSGGAGWVAG